MNMQINTQLMTELKGFGLNPKDWSLVKQKAHTYKIAHNSDQNFILKGTTKLKEKKLTWDFISVVSL